MCPALRLEMKLQCKKLLWGFIRCVYRKLHDGSRDSSSPTGQSRMEEWGAGVQQERKTTERSMVLLRGDSCLQKEFGEELICRKPKQQSKYNFQEKQNTFIKKKNAISAYYKTLPGQCWHSQNNVTLTTGLTPSLDCYHVRRQVCRISYARKLNLNSHTRSQ